MPPKPSNIRTEQKMRALFIVSSPSLARIHYFYAFCSTYPNRNQVWFVFFFMINSLSAEAVLDEKEVRQAIIYLDKMLSSIESMSHSTKDDAIQLAESEVVLEQWQGTSGEKAVTNTKQCLTQLSNIIEALDNEKLTIIRTINDLEVNAKMLAMLKYQD